ncbi:MAG: PilN domain-containing protein [Thiohalocapsa sp.]
MALSTQMRLPDADALRRAVAWWLAELRALLPGRLGEYGGGRPAILEFSANGAALELPNRSAEAADRLPLDGLDSPEARDRVQSALRARRTGDDVVVRLDPSLLLRSSVTLPLAAERSLRQIVEHQLDRLVPLPPEAVYFECRVRSRSPAAKTLNVELACVTRASIEEAVALATSLGLVPRLAVAAGDGAAVEPPMVLWRAAGAEQSRRSRRLKRGLELAAALLIVIAYGTSVYRLDEAQDELEAEVAQATKAATAVREQVRQQTEAQNALALLHARLKEPSPLALLDQLTTAIPDSAWVAQLTLLKGNIEIIGYSANVTDLVLGIDKSDAFKNVGFRSPTTLSPDGKGQRFDLSFEAAAGTGAKSP